ncbi:hypothetical protein EYZ11_003615 [Aspergillus tanneri]|uniref:Uncharacterized protein n=1 Tax=Aspergillus tanneri TaxID=1220188 RepID=A0A4S3JQ00_9EURO|nr:hypothetical protein EYZ11_003615 [Aspergillus tanneri]
MAHRDNLDASEALVVGLKETRPVYSSILGRAKFSGSQQEIWLPTRGLS